MSASHNARRRRGRPLIHHSQSDLRAQLGEQVRLIAAEDGITQGVLADMLECSPKHLSEVVNGLSGKPEFFDRVADTCGFRWEVRRVPL